MSAYKRFLEKFHEGLKKKETEHKKREDDIERNNDKYSLYIVKAGYYEDLKWFGNYLTNHPVKPENPIEYQLPFDHYSLFESIMNEFAKDEINEVELTKLFGIIKENRKKLEN